MLRQTRLAAFVALLIAAGPVAADPPGQPPASEQPLPFSEDVKLLGSSKPEDRVAASERIMANAKEAMPALLAAVASYDDMSMQNSNDDRLLAFVAVTDVLRSIVLRDYSIVVAARTEVKRRDHARIFHPLIAAAGGELRSVRVNATLILASIVDNGTVCLVLDQLRSDSRNAPEKVNLVQVLLAMASYAFRENVQAGTDTVNFLRSQSANYLPGEWRRMPGLLDQVSQRLDASVNKETEIAPPEDVFCKNFAYHKRLP